MIGSNACRLEEEGERVQRGIIDWEVVGKRGSESFSVNRSASGGRIDQMRGDLFEALYGL
jgi:hypothetical protein